MCGKNRELKNPKILCNFEEILVLSIIVGKCETEDEKIFREEGPIEILKITGLIKNI